MLHLALRFPTGRYHATPWGRHVNEGQIEWPPSPFRLLRALLSTGFTKLGWVTPPEEANRLFTKLLGVAPTYALPRSVGTGHTRHYVPQYSGSTAKIIDTFAVVGRDADALVGVSWDVPLDAAELSLVDELARSLAYLGRAESWVLCERVSELPSHLVECRPAERAPRPGLERMRLLAPLSADEYAAWRAEAVSRALEERMATETQRLSAMGKTVPKAFAKKAAERAQGLFPQDALRVLEADTAELQSAGWSQPPGTRWLSYWLPEDALSPTSPRASSTRTRASFADVALLALASDTSRKEVLPPFSATLPRMETLHESLTRLSDLGDGLGPLPCFSGKDADGPLRGHGHAFLLPLDLEGTGRLNHVLVYAPRGFDREAQATLSRLRKTYGKGLPTIFVTLAGLGTRSDLASIVPHVTECAPWRSETPFVPPRFLKPRGPSSLEGQVHAELDSRGLPLPARIEVELEQGGYAPIADFWGLWQQRRPGAVTLAEGTPAAGGAMAALTTRWRHFRRARREGREPPMAAAFGLRLSFSSPVRGPIAIGYASHFGMGSFRPEE